jgi:hypothetical protein
MTKRKQQALAVLSAAQAVIDVQGEERMLAGRRVLQSYLGPFDIMAHRIGDQSQLELYRLGSKVANLRWNGSAFEIATFKPGDWQQELIALSANHELERSRSQCRH